MEILYDMIGVCWVYFVFVFECNLDGWVLGFVGVFMDII